MKNALPALTLAAAACCGAAQAQIFDAVHPVAANGGTVPVTSFVLDGPAPWLYLDLAGPLDDASGIFASLRFDANPADAVPAIEFAAEIAGGTGNDKFWLTPSAANWAANKSAGAWQFKTGVWSIALICIYGGCVGAPGGFSSAAGPTVVFTVGNVPQVPEPGSPALWALGMAGLLGAAALRRAGNPGCPSAAPV